MTRELRQTLKYLRENKLMIVVIVRAYGPTIMSCNNIIKLINYSELEYISFTVILNFLNLISCYKS